MVTKEQAVAARHGKVFYHREMRNSDGTPLRVRVTGRCRTWKTRPAEFSLPVKHGLRDCGYITHRNAAEWDASEGKALETPMGKGKE